MTNITTGLDSINKLPSLVAYAKEINMKGLVITNHDNLSEVIEINRMQKKLKKDNDDFVLGIGNEIYLIDKYIDDDKVRQTYYHFILIAKDKIGYQALVELSTRAWYRSSILRNKRRVPTEKQDLVEVMQWAKGHLIGANACLGGELATLVNTEKYKEADEFCVWCQDLFGYDDFYIELQPSDFKEQKKFNLYAYNHYKNDYKFIITTDAHYLKKEHFPIFEAFLRSQQEKRQVKEYYDYARLMDEEEITSLMCNMGIPSEFVRECLDNTLKVSEQIEFYDLAQTQIIPKVPLKQVELTISENQLEEVKQYPTLSWALTDIEEGTRYCINYCLNSLNNKGLWSKQYLDRLEEEFEVHKYQSEQLNSNFYNYVNCCQWVIDRAWEIDCAVGPGRGSAGGCLINFLMDVTQIDSIQYDLKFWRYLNKVRTSPLDIDTDFQPSKKAELFAEIRKYRGELGMLQVATYRTLTLKAAIGNAGRGYRSKEFPDGLDPDIIIYLSSLVEQKRGFVATLKQTLEGDEEQGFKKNTTFIKKCEEYPGLMDVIKMIENIITGSSTHASAVVLFDEQDRLIDHCSLMRAPNGDLCTSLDLHTVEEAGCFKLDLLWLSTLDIQATCFKLLQRDNKIDPSLSLKECFKKYIDVNKIDYNIPKIWDLLYENKVLDVFQFNAPSGRKGVLAMHPSSLDEMTFLNAAIRLVTPEGEESQIERAVRLKGHLDEFDTEMINNQVTEERRTILHQELDKMNGCCAGQETFMILSQRLVNFSLKEADALRKTVAKKKIAEIAKQKELFLSKAKAAQCSDAEANYLWNVCIEPSKSYSFNFAHGTVYSMIGVQCILMGGVLFPSIYWQTACLLQRSGALDDKSADYNKIAKAVSLIRKLGVKIVPVNVNKSDKEFSVDVENNTIFFGLAGVKGLRAEAIEKIMTLRPFESFYDFIVRTSADVTSIVNLIKCDAFSDFGSQEEQINILSRLKADQKIQLNGQNLAMLARSGLWSQDDPVLEKSLYCFNFTRYLKLIAKRMPEAETYANSYYWLDERAKDYLDRIDFYYEGDYLLKTTWKCYYDLMMEPIKKYIADNQEELLCKVNEQAVSEWRQDHFPQEESKSQWEIMTMGLCFSEHPIAKLKNLTNYDTLPTEPEVDRFTKIKERLVPLYKLYTIVGIVIAKDKQRDTITLLTPTGPVDVKFRKEQFASYDAQISKIVDGKKKIIERSWFNRGSALVISGMRQDDIFIAKTYKNSKMRHTAYKITAILDDNSVKVQKERKSGKKEESQDE